MGVRSKIVDLPADKREELERRLIDGGFRGYVELEAWLAQHGHEISKSAIHRYGSKLEEKIARLKASAERARYVVESSPDIADNMAQATMRLLQEKLYVVLEEMDDLDPESVDLVKLSKAMAPLVRASIAQKQYAQEVAERARAAADMADRIASKGGLSSDAAAEIRRAILGVAA